MYIDCALERQRALGWKLTCHSLSPSPPLGPSQVSFLLKALLMLAHADNNDESILTATTVITVGEEKRCLLPFCVLRLV